MKTGQMGGGPWKALPIRAVLFLIVPAMAAELPAARAESDLNASLQVMEDWLGTWHVEAAAETPARVERVEYRVALGGHFVESWREDLPERHLRSHSMITADANDGVLMEYRFDDQGQMTIHPFSTAGGPLGRRISTETDQPQRSMRVDPSLDIPGAFLGQWEVTTGWFDGGLLWARMSNDAELGGRIVCSSVLAKEADKAPYDRYRTFYFRDGAGALREVTFTYRGFVVNEPLTVERTADGVEMRTLYRPGSLGSIGIRKELTLTSERAIHWTSYFQQEVSETWEKVIDANWIRIGGPDPLQRTMPVDDTLFIGSGSAVRSMTSEREMEAAPEQVRNAWTTEAGWRAAYSAGRPEVRANIELRPGGKYEWLFDGELGCNGCQSFL